MDKLLSVIVPVYNGEAFIGRCVGSILAQEGFDRRRLEVLLINDGSSDNSLEGLRNSAGQYPDVIRVIDQENRGAARTRNRGIQLARGKYVMLIDQDDYIDVDYCKRFYEAAESGDYDVVVGGFRTVDETGRVTSTRQPSNTAFSKFLFIPAWAKIHRTQFLKENDITFFDNNIGEDNVFTTQEIVCTQKYELISYTGYNNSFANATNVTNTFHKGLSKDVDIVRLLMVLSSMKSNDASLDKMLSYNVVRTAIYYLLAYGRSAPKQRFKEVYKEVFQALAHYVPHYERNRYLVWAPAGEILAVRIGVAGFMLLHKLHLVRLFAMMYCGGKR